MLGDCYCAAVVEHLSRKELMACDAINFYQDITPGQISTAAQRRSVPELIVVSLSEHNNSKLASNGSSGGSTRGTEKQKQ
jgi:predicted aminopeptidase